MKARHHFWSSLAVGGALYAATGSAGALAGAMVGGFLIDSDHIVDQLWSIRRGAPYSKKRAEDDLAQDSRGLRDRVAHFFRRRKLVRLPLIFHSYELLAAIIVLTVKTPAPFMTGLVAGYSLHLALDVLKHHHEHRSPFFYLLAYRVVRGFRRERLLKPEYN